MEHIHQTEIVHTESAIDATEAPISLSHLVHILTRYRAAIRAAFLAVALVGAAAVLLTFLFAPSQKLTTMPFRLDFEGATENKYPNGLRFSPTEIISPPVLQKVFAANHLDQFTAYNEFSQSVFVLESNAAYDILAADYQSRLADPRLTVVDRERIQQDFELKRKSISKNEFSINYVRPRKTSVPEPIARKTLTDILTTWATMAATEQHVFDYRVAVLSPQIIDDTVAEADDYVAYVQVLRSKIYRVIQNIGLIERLPGAELAKTSAGQSLSEVAIRLEEIVRYQLEPLVGEIRDGGLVKNPSGTIRFLENQLAFDERQLKAATTLADNARDALAVYALDQRTLGATPEQGQPKTTAPRPSGETVMPQLSDTFLDRLVALASQSVDTRYRQTLVDEYRTALRLTVPLQQAVAYDREILKEMQRSGRAATIPPTALRARITAVQDHARNLIVAVNDLYRIVSRNLRPPTEMFTITAPPSSRITRAQTLPRLLLYYLALLLVSLPVIIVICLLHNRVREEEAVDAELRSAHVE